MTVYFIRHGSTLAMDEPDSALFHEAQTDVLSVAGRDEARKLAHHFARLPNVGAVITSPMKRALDTAGPIAEACGLRPIVDERLRERDFHFGPEVTLAESQSRQLRSIRSPLEQVCGAESVAAHLARIRAFLAEQALAVSSEGDVLVVSHGGTVEMLHTAIMALPLQALRRHHVRLDPGHFHRWAVRTWAEELLWRLDGVNLAPAEDPCA